MEGAAHDFMEGLRSRFAELRDPRVAASCDHLLIDIVAITILAVASGADNWTDLETFGRLLGSAALMPRHGTSMGPAMMKYSGLVAEDALTALRMLTIAASNWLLSLKITAEP